MNLLDIICEKCIQIRTGTTDKDSLLHEIASLSIKSSVLQNVPEKKIYDALKYRENAGSTGFGGHIAIPHCSLPGISDFVVGFLIYPDGVDFNALDGRDTKLFIFIIGPSEKRNEHIQLLAAISRILQTETVVQEIVNAKTATSALDSLLRYASVSVLAPGKEKQSLIHIFIQNEDWFSDILQVLSEIGSSSISVIEANDASYYLQTMPLFSGFFTEKARGFHRVIITSIRKSLVNELYRQITMITGNIERIKGLIIITQEISYWNGELNY
jgi:mannitol/fructose-specific phosphotransferase system IIA component (Ntr-type)